VLDFGIGAIVMAHGTQAGMPVVAIMAVDNHGEIGTPAPEMMDEMQAGCTILKFHSVQGALGLLDRIKDAIEGMVE